jgi:hypothetical protein
VNQGFIRELRHRDPFLFWVGAANLLALIVCALLSIGDQRLVLGINVWIKPMKFLISIATFVWTVAWFMPEITSPKRRQTLSLVMGSSMTIENICIIGQAFRGTTSHFNNNTPLDAIVFAVMGITIMINTFAMAVFLAGLRRDTPTHRAGYLWGIRAGVVIFLLASAQGGLLVSNNAHSVGGPDGGPGLPFVNWSTEFGDLRIAHFVGLHALQLLPLFGFFLDRFRVPGRNLVLAVSIIWLAVMGGLLVIAMQGEPLIAL